MRVLENAAMTDTTIKIYKMRVVDPDAADLDAEFVDLLDGAIAFTPKGHAYWKPLFAEIGIDIDRLMTPKTHAEVMTRVAKIREDRSPAYAALFAILEMDPVLLAQYEREAKPFLDRPVEEGAIGEEPDNHRGLDRKKKRLGLRVVAGDKAKR